MEKVLPKVERIGQDLWKELTQKINIKRKCPEFVTSLDEAFGSAKRRIVDRHGWVAANDVERDLRTRYTSDTDDEIGWFTASPIEYGGLDLPFFKRKPKLDLIWGPIYINPKHFTSFSDTAKEAFVLHEETHGIAYLDPWYEYTVEMMNKDETFRYPTHFLDEGIAWASVAKIMGDGALLESIKPIEAATRHLSRSTRNSIIQERIYERTAGKRLVDAGHFDTISKAKDLVKPEVIQLIFGDKKDRLKESAEAFCRAFNDIYNGFRQRFPEYTII